MKSVFEFSVELKDRWLSHAAYSRLFLAILARSVECFNVLQMGTKLPSSRIKSIDFHCQLILLFRPERKALSDKKQRSAPFFALLQKDILLRVEMRLFPVHPSRRKGRQEGVLWSFMSRKHWSDFFAKEFLFFFTRSSSHPSFG